MAICFDNYITLSEDVLPSRSGRYATDLPGIDVQMIDAIARDESGDYEDIWPTIYKRAYKNLVSDTSKNLANKFYVDLKLISRETSAFKADTNSNQGYAGVTLEFKMPRYAKVHIISVGVNSLQSYGSPGFTLKFFDTDQNGEELDSISDEVSPGRNTINIDREYEVDKLFIAYDASAYSIKQTENKRYATPYDSFDEVICDFCFWSDDFRGSVVQVNGGGLNIKYLVYCSAEKLVCENIKLFEQALLYKIGHEITVERRLGERLNRFTIMTKERWDELEGFYKAQYEQDLMNVISQANIPEDQVCYQCKNTVMVESYLP